MAKKNHVAITLKDSCNFLQASLDSLVRNLDLGPTLKKQKKAYPHCWRFYKNKFPHLDDKLAFPLLISKGYFPYEYFDHFDKLNETQLPPREDFYSKLKGETITAEQYKHCQQRNSSS